MPSTAADATAERRVAAAETGAARIANWQPEQVPGLLQTTELTRSIIRGLPGGELLSDAELSARALYRTHRQLSVFGRTPPVVCRFILRQTVLEQLAGLHREIACEQLRKLLRALGPSTSVLVLPAKFALSAFPATGPYHLIEGADGAALLLREQTDGGSRFFTSTGDPAEIEACRQASIELAGACLDQARSRHLVEILYDELAA